MDGLGTKKQARAVRRKAGFLFSNADSQIIMPAVAEDVAIGPRRPARPRPAGPAR
ncbi:hypothetical protein ACBR40_15170 [Nonomuraea sp. AD125B]|uniref:hypothetical protein n=1 Tax=Nonomuraea TaxID=83681 RepID=UPI0031CF84BD